MPYSQDYTFDQIAEGFSICRPYRIDSAVYEALLLAFQDESPLHVDENYARARGFAGPLMHGAILNGFLSEFVGMQFPGRRALLLSVSLHYLKPSYLGDQLRLEARVSQKVESQRVIVLSVTFYNETQGGIVAQGRVQVAVSND